ncbi:hypothetical protein Hypma_012615 [Hypsizygus marmoreus]|uniref:Uncharacterized protein n=1 Tax=Hypsizygus marmoreus TaxID=39966 RepID=A0A369JEK6_HYPMA|nr:hypothetical protein Hypma_012615 [Hypsizygus marmoreus]
MIQWNLGTRLHLDTFFSRLAGELFGSHGQWRIREDATVHVILACVAEPNDPSRHQKQCSAHLVRCDILSRCHPAKPSLSPLLRLSRLDRVPPLQRLTNPPHTSSRRLSAFTPFEAQCTNPPSLLPPISKPMPRASACHLLHSNLDTAVDRMRVGEGGDNLGKTDTG